MVLTNQYQTFRDYKLFCHHYPDAEILGLFHHKLLLRHNIVVIVTQPPPLPSTHVFTTPITDKKP